MVNKDNDEVDELKEEKCSCGHDHCGDEEITDSDVEVAMLQNELEAKEQEIKENIDSLQRIMAEFDNYKKRTLKERETIYSDVKAEIMENFLVVLDNFEKALENMQDGEVKNGILLIQKQFLEVLTKNGIKEIEALNKTFNPKLHESVQHVEDKNFGEKEIIKVFRKGYILGDKVIRYSMVKVAN